MLSTCDIRIQNGGPPFYFESLKTAIFHGISGQKLQLGIVLKMFLKCTDLKITVRSDTKYRTSYLKLILAISTLNLSEKDNKYMNALKTFPNYVKFQRSERKVLGNAFHISN